MQRGFMLKKTALAIGTLLTTSSSWAQMLVHLNLTASENSQHQSVVVEDNQEATCKLDDLLFEVKAHKQHNNVDLAIKIFVAAQNTKTLVASQEFNTEFDTAASLTLERDGKDMQLTIVTVDIV